MIIHPKILQLTSITLSRCELEAGLSLIRAFFPEGKVQIDTAEDLKGPERDCKAIQEPAFQPETEKMNPQNTQNKLIQEGKYETGNGTLRESKDLSLPAEKDKPFAKIKIEIKTTPNPNLNQGSNSNEASDYDTGSLSDIHSFERSLQVHAQFSSHRVGLPDSEITLNSHQVQQILAHPQIGKESKRKLLLKHGLFHLLSQVTGHTPPWGILTGIRPSKILHYLEDFTLTEAPALHEMSPNTSTSSEARNAKVLRERYAIREDKIRLLQEIVTIQRPYLKAVMDHPEHIAVYVGIPFCPTRCTYCSFPAYSLQQGREPLQKYLKGLYEEIRVTGEWMKETGRQASSLYLGGGTPTILSTSEISHLLQWVRQNIPLTETNELSVEAGRPDTLSKEKLQALREQGVNRLSINPQTMHERTLKRIGRAHTVDDVIRIYELARAISGWTINMDLILGLPGEGVEDVRDTLEQIRELKPDNLTVHTLAIKRGSKEHEAGLTRDFSTELEEMQEMILAAAHSLGLRPYYLYRQKHIAGNLENIGFARPGRECRYNIGIMEERQSIIGIGAGASSKVVNPGDYSLVNFQHPSYWQVYLERWPEIHKKRVGQFNYFADFI